MCLHIHQKIYTYTHVLWAGLFDLKWESSQCKSNKIEVGQKHTSSNPSQTQEMNTTTHISGQGSVFLCGCPAVKVLASVLLSFSELSSTHFRLDIIIYYFSDSD